MPKSKQTRRKKKEKRRKLIDPLEQAKTQSRSRKAQANMGRTLLNKSLSNRGRTKTKKPPQPRAPSLTVSEKRQLTVEGARALGLPGPVYGQPAPYDRPLTSVSIKQRVGKTAGQRRKLPKKKKGKARKSSMRTTLTPGQAFLKKQIDIVHNVAALKPSMVRIFNNSQPMPTSTAASIPDTRKALAGSSSSANKALGASSVRGKVEPNISISPVFQCRVSINSMSRASPDWLSSIPTGFQPTISGESGPMAANVMNAGITITEQQRDAAFINEFGNPRRKNKEDQYSLNPPPDPRDLNNGDYIIESRKWKLMYSWMTCLPLLWGVQPGEVPPLHCEHKLPLFWLAAFGCGPETKLALYSNINQYRGIIEDMSTRIGESPDQIQNKMFEQTTVGNITDQSSLERTRAGEDPAMRRARVSQEFVFIKHTVREECYAWEFPCVNSTIKSQMVFINLILGSNDQLYYVIAKQAISNYVDVLSKNANAASCVSMWYTILMNILWARGVNKDNWDRITEAVPAQFRPLRNRGQVVDLIRQAAANGGEGIIGLVNSFLSPQQKSQIPGGEYTKQYIYNSMVIQLLKLTSLLNNTVNAVCKWGSTLADGGIRNNLYLNYIRLKRFCEANPATAIRMGVQKSGVNLIQPSTGIYTVLRTLRSNNSRERNTAQIYIQNLQNANGQLGQNYSTQRGGSLRGINNGNPIDLGNSNFSSLIGEQMRDIPLDQQQDIEESLDEYAQNLLTGYEAGVDSSGMSSSDSSPAKKSPKRTPQKSSSGSHRNLQFSSASASSSPPRYILSTPQQQQYYKSPGTGYRGADESSPQRQSSIRRQGSIIQRQESIGDGYMGDNSQDPFSSQFSQGFSQGGGKKKKKKKTKKKKRRRKKRTRRK